MREAETSSGCIEEGEKGRDPDGRNILETAAISRGDVECQHVKRNLSHCVCVLCNCDKTNVE